MSNPTYRFLAGQGQPDNPQLGPFNLNRYAAGVLYEQANADFLAGIGWRELS
jgi:hypothetical protein